MYIGRKKISVKKDNREENEVEIETKYMTPEILMIDCDEKECRKLKEKGFNVQEGSFGKIYPIKDKSGGKKVILNSQIDNIIERDVVVIDMKQRKTSEIYELVDVYGMEEGKYITTHKGQEEFNPINISSKFYEEDFKKLREKDSIIIIFSDWVVDERYNLTTIKSTYHDCITEKISNYSFLPFTILPSRSSFKTEKYSVVATGILKSIFKNFKGEIHSNCTFDIGYYEEKDTIRLLENIYGDLIGYIQIYQKQSGIKNTFIVLPQCENISLIIENILVEVLPELYPEMFECLVKDSWLNKEEYLLPEVKNIINEKVELENEYIQRLNDIDQRIKIKQEENKFMYDIISSSGTGEKLVESIIKCLEYVGYENVEDWDKIRSDDEKEEDLHIYKNEKDYFVAEVKGVNGPPIEDDCNVIVKYKSRNSSKLGIPFIHGAVFVNYHKNVEPNQREELGFTKKEIKDAIRDGYTLIGTYQLFKAIRLIQEEIITKESVRKSLETPGIFNAIPNSFESVGKIENILDRINVICVPIECDKLQENDELLIVEGNNYYKTKIVSMMVNENIVKEAKKDEKVGIKIDKVVPKIKSSHIYLIK